MAEEQLTYLLRRSQGAWYIRTYQGWGLDTFVSEIGPYTYAEAQEQAKVCGLPDADKGQDGNHFKDIR